MTDPISPLPTLDSAVQEFINVWAANLGQVLAQISGTAFAVESSLTPPPEFPVPQEHDLQMSVVVAGSLRGEMNLRVPRPAMLGLGQLFLQEPQNASAELKPDHRDALEELLRQAAGQIATGLSSRWGEAQLRVQAGAPPSWSEGARGWFLSGPGVPYRLLMEWQLSAALIAGLKPATKDVPTAASGDVGAGGPDKLDLLMDVELDVALRFGKRSMRLWEILELDAGSVIELDRQVQEPADLLLDGRLIARGEVVVVDGNYGLRVLEMISSPE